VHDGVVRNRSLNPQVFDAIVLNAIVLPTDEPVGVMKFDAGWIRRHGVP
jgi:hypothetical protein